jgi:uncharacterized protein (TIGR00266 family)
MKAELRFKPSFTTLFVELGPGDSIVAESDAMASMSTGTVMRTRFNGGFFRAILRKLFGDESLFVNEFSAPPGRGSGELVLTQPTPGDMEAIELKGETIYLQPGAFVACTPGVSLKLGWAGFASWFGGEGLFRLKMSGTGTVWMGGYGGVFTRDVQGEYVVDTGHLLAYEPGLSLKVGLAGGIFSSFFGGEGFVSRVRGHGKIYMQSRSLDGLAAWTNGHIV